MLLAAVFDDRLASAPASRSAGPLPCDIFEDGEGVVVRFELAGVDPKDVDIRFENGVLTMRASGSWRRRTRRRTTTGSSSPTAPSPGPSRSPAPSTSEKIRAESKNGVLAVHPAEEGRGEAEGHPGEGRASVSGAESPERRGRARQHGGPLRLFLMARPAGQSLMAGSDGTGEIAACRLPFSTLSILDLPLEDDALLDHERGRLDVAAHAGRLVQLHRVLGADVPDRPRRGR